MESKILMRALVQLESGYKTIMIQRYQQSSIQESYILNTDQHWPSPLCKDEASSKAGLRVLGRGNQEQWTYKLIVQRNCHSKVLTNRFSTTALNQQWAPQESKKHSKWLRCDRSAGAANGTGFSATESNETDNQERSPIVSQAQYSEGNRK